MHVLVLGPLEVIDDNGVAVTLSGARIRALTALLALEAGHVVSTDRLIDAIYGEQLPQSSANALQLQVSRLRQALKASSRIVTRPPGYLLDLAPDDIDAMRFERLVADGRAALAAGSVADGSRLLHQALALWRGDALADFAFDDFATGARARLHELRLSATEDCIEADLDLGRPVECAEQLERLVAAHPLRERLWGLLMIALYRSGRQAEALRAFQIARRHLGDELGIDPGPELRRLETAVLGQDESLAGPARPTAAAAGPAPLPTGNLARPLTACLGRDAEMVALHQLLESHRLVTLIGPGGTGKTRLAVEVGLTSDATAWMIDLCSVSEGQGVMPAIRTALGLQAPSMGSLADAPSTAGLAAALGDRDAVIVLDNCEHVIADAAFAAAELVAACPRLRILATSRESLGVPGEVLYAVPPLAQDAAVVLFAERATASAPGIAFDEAATAAIADICRRLDGLPLAIELAAARVRALDVAQISIRLNDRFRLLTTGPRTLLPRQRTLRAVVDWSYDLLEGGERTLFERLSVFARAASLDAVEAVCAGAGIDDFDVAQLISRLVDKSLVVVARTPAGNRYSMLQTLAEYAAEKLSPADDVHQRHADWVLALVRSAERGAGTRPTVSLAELEAEVDNVDAALAWARTHNPALAYELAGRLGWFWFWTGRIDLGWQALSGAGQSAADGVSCTLRTRAAAWGGMLGTVMRADGAADLVLSAVDLGRSCGHQASLGQALVIRATLTILRGRPSLAEADLAEAGACYSAAGDLHGQGIVSMVQGMAAIAGGRYADAEANYERSVSFLDAAGDEWAAGVSVQRLVELAERRARSLDLDGTAPAAGVPSRFSEALIRAQLAATRRRDARPAAPASAATDALALAVADHIRGRVTLRQNRPLDARSDLELALSRYRAQGHTAAVASCLADLGRLATAIGDAAAAVRFHAEATSAAITSSDATIVLSALEALSAALAAIGDGQRAGLALGVADVLREHGTRPWDATLDDRGPTESAAAALLGETVLLQVRSAGRVMRIEDLLDDLVPA